MDTQKLERARQYLERASQTTDSERRLLCLYDAFVSLYGLSEAISKASQAAGVEASELRACLSACNDDSDVGACPRVEVKAELLKTLQNALEQIL